MYVALMLLCITSAISAWGAHLTNEHRDECINVFL